MLYSYVTTHVTPIIFRSADRQFCALSLRLVFVSCRFIMVRQISEDLRGRLLTFRQLNYSSSMAVKTLQKESIRVSERTVQRVWEQSKTGASGESPKQKKNGKRGPLGLRNSMLVKKVDSMISKPNPVSQRSMAKKAHVSVSTINRTIHQNLGGKIRKKVSVPHLTEKQIAQRKTRALPFYKMISENLHYILSLDEAMLPLDFTNGQTKHFYEKKTDREEGVVAPLAVGKAGFYKQRMFAAGFSYRGPTRLYIVPKGSKVNADVFIKEILEPMLMVDMRKLYGKEMSKVIVHMDSASSHTATKTQQWLRDHNIKFFTKEEWLANSPEVSPMDFFANGVLKQRLKLRKFTTETGMIRAAKDEWSKIPLQTFQNAIDSWPLWFIRFTKLVASLVTFV